MENITLCLKNVDVHGKKTTCHCQVWLLEGRQDNFLLGFHWKSMEIHQENHILAGPVGQGFPWFV